MDEPQKVILEAQGIIEQLEADGTSDSNIKKVMLQIGSVLKHVTESLATSTTVSAATIMAGKIFLEEESNDVGDTIKESFEGLAGALKAIMDVQKQQADSIPGLEDETTKSAIKRTESAYKTLLKAAGRTLSFSINLVQGGIHELENEVAQSIHSPEHMLNLLHLAAGHLEHNQSSSNQMHGEIHYLIVMMIMYGVKQDTQRLRTELEMFQKAATQLLENTIQTRKYAVGMYEGEIRNGRRHGRGKMTYDSGNVYIGDWIADKKDGNGVFMWASGSKYQGEFKDDKKCGQGVFDYHNGNRYDGEWKDNKKWGKGKFILPDGVYEDGEYKNDHKVGWHIKTYKTGRKEKILYQNGMVKQRTKI